MPQLKRESSLSGLSLGAVAVGLSRPKAFPQNRIVCRLGIESGQELIATPH